MKLVTTTEYVDGLHTQIEALQKVCKAIGDFQFSTIAESKGYPAAYQELCSIKRKARLAVLNVAEGTIAQ